MSDKFEFTKNNNDLSTDSGFQFEFVCERCGTGYRSTFKEYLLGKAAGVLDIASSLFGGALGRASSVGHQVVGRLGKGPRQRLPRGHRRDEA